MAAADPSFVDSICGVWWDQGEGEGQFPLHVAHNIQQSARVDFDRVSGSRRENKRR